MAIIGFLYSRAKFIFNDFNVISMTVKDFVLVSFTEFTYKLQVFEIAFDTIAINLTLKFVVSVTMIYRMLHNPC